MSKSATIIINIYIYLIVSKNRVSEIENDQNDHDHFDRPRFFYGLKGLIGLVAKAALAPSLSL